MIGSYKFGFIFGSCLLLTLIWCDTALGRVSQKQQPQKDQEETQEEFKVEVPPSPLPDHIEKVEDHHEKNNPSLEEQSSASQCFRCCDSGIPMYQPMPMPMPQINITILKGEKGDRGERGLQGKFGKTGSIGKFYCYVPGIYFFSLNVHTWNQKETYLHIMKNDAEVVILYAQHLPSLIFKHQAESLLKYHSPPGSLLPLHLHSTGFSLNEKCYLFLNFVMPFCVTLEISSIIREGNM
ncbi:complement C1q tumor necrosis factor-related protein 1 isoform X3 [Antechinus flavipes]|uniref:complement C1q tumor necrosis factor-related protein 1 isoform X3 n=1 Tax=Antechinus flavipes TaxID=38775 RepID=UPI0022369253|nr:complement C1q tumor necrosis factor-related protein 1 isoform X3 [Antechinus flavipes]